MSNKCDGVVVSCMRLADRRTEGTSLHYLCSPLTPHRHFNSTPVLLLQTEPAHSRDRATFTRELLTNIGFYMMCINVTKRATSPKTR